MPSLGWRRQEPLDRPGALGGAQGLEHQSGLRHPARPLAHAPLLYEALVLLGDEKERRHLREDHGADRGGEQPSEE